MTINKLPFLRLAVQGLSTAAGSLTGAMHRMLAVQGQDYPGGKWSLSLRCTGCTDPQVERAFASREIVRTWAMRGTLHILAAADLRWLVALVGPRIIAGNARRYRELELDGIILRRSADVLSAALAGGKQLDRPALFKILDAQGISTAGQRGVYILQHASLLGLICQGAAIRNKPTFYLIDDFLPASAAKSEDEALATLAKRYFTSRSPATLQDFVWWAGLPVGKARRALELARPYLFEQTLEGQAYWFSSEQPAATGSVPRIILLPGFDEYLLSYKDRGALMDVSAIRAWTPKNGMLPATILVDGRVTGVWKRMLKKDNVVIAWTPFRNFTPSEQLGMEQASRQYGEFLGLKPKLKLDLRMSAQPYQGD